VQAELTDPATATELGRLCLRMGYGSQANASATPIVQ